ncbi:MAG: HTTM domain-containing protein [Flavobacteriaceae bacterium]|nr:MAG: HTTM domain-containing protein [Flavobacteriaceae bacterium]
MIQKTATYLKIPVKTAPLAVFRILFGLLMTFAIIRFLSYGWVSDFYIAPKFFFKYYGFEFVKPIGNYTYGLFVIALLSAIGMMLGYRYRLSAILFFLIFTYIELMDKTTYLNHYYFVSLMAFILIFLPANSYFSIDAQKNTNIAFDKIPRYCILIIQWMLAIVYFYAGLAKINSDWLLEAMPLKIWLPARYDIPLLGDLFQKEWVHYFMSWGGMLYDLTIPFLLFYKRTRIFAFILVVIFHILTRVLFPIGIFPFVMIFATLIFFGPAFHENIIGILKRRFRLPQIKIGKILRWAPTVKNKLLVASFILFFTVQLLFPFRYLLYPGELFWTEEGYRFSWRVMLMEKAGYAQFKVVNPETNKQFYIRNHHFLNSFQEKQMQTQPDFILQYAHFLAAHYKKQGIKNPEVYVESYVALNGRRSQPYIDPNIDLTKIKESFKHKDWILPFNDSIYGF